MDLEGPPARWQEKSFWREAGRVVCRMSVDLSVGLSIGIALLVWSVRCRRSFGSVLVCRSSSLSSVFWLGLSVSFHALR